jgi:hypothetical protein
MLRNLLFLFAVSGSHLLYAQGLPSAKVVVFSQPGFPSVDTPAISREVLAKALGQTSSFANIQQLQAPETLHGASLLVLPYGSAFPMQDWSTIESYLRGGGNLLLIGGQALRVPVLGDGSSTYTEQQPQDTYSRQVGFLHTYAIPADSVPLHFAWRRGYDFLPAVSLTPERVFVEEGRLNGLAYLESADGTRMAAPVIFADHGFGSPMPGSRIVALPFTAGAGFWSSDDGLRLLRTAADYASAGATTLMIETQYAALRPGELPLITVRLRGSNDRSGDSARTALPAGEVHLELRRGDELIDSATMPLRINESVQAPFHKPVVKGLYTVRALWRPAAGSAPAEAAENGFVVEDLGDLETGPALATSGNFITLGGAPFFPVGTNYFSTESNGWDFSGPRNDAVWERDFADMQRHNVSFVRTGVWGGYGKFIEPLTGKVNERFLRNLEAYLAAAHRHGIVVNFTFFAFSPRTSEPRSNAAHDNSELGPNPYLDPAALVAERAYITSVVDRFGHLPWLSYDLINEPSFSNPRIIFHGNVPNRDPAEVSAWRKWLRTRYGTLETLAAAWRVTPDDLRSFDSIDLPASADLSYDRYGNAHEVRAFDYNLFAQDMFSDWVRYMVAGIRDLGSRQLIDVGQDEGGVSNRLLNQFYATAGVSFTTNHTYWNDDALVWDSVAAKRPGMPNITGETGYQPAWNADGTWRYDELTGTAIEERKWVLGFAAGSSGAVQWDWDREVDFGMQRSDGSVKPWEAMMAKLGSFARAAAPHATALELPQIAIILPQSLQLSVQNGDALQAQQTAVRVLYGYNRVEAYAVGSFQTDTLGTPRLILLPSPMGLNAKAWTDIEARVRAGAVLLISGPFDGDEHMHPTGRAAQLGLPYELAPLQQRDEKLMLPSGELPLEYTGLKTTTLDRARMPGGKSWTEIALGQGHILFSALPLELNSRLDTIAAAYSVAIKLAGITRTYTMPPSQPGITIVPTRLPDSTLYAITSETADSTVHFKDGRSGKEMTSDLAAGRGALLLIGLDGRTLAEYNWQPESKSAP